MHDPRGWKIVPDAIRHQHSRRVAARLFRPVLRSRASIARFNARVLHSRARCAS